VPARRGPKGASKLTPQLAERIRELDAAGATLSEIAARGGRRPPVGGPDSTGVREWAKAQGIEVKDRGRVPAEVVARFKAATAQ
jgi:hypothetical protein